MIDFIYRVDVGEIQALEERLNEIFTHLSKAFFHCLDVGVEVMFVDDEQMRNINKEHRSIDKTTDVLSLGMEICGLDFRADSIDLIREKNEIPLLLGSIIINVKIAESSAKEFAHSFIDEVSLLFVHAFLHIAGFDHEKDNGEHRAQERKWAKELALPKMLTERS